MYGRSLTALHRAHASVRQPWGSVCSVVPTTQVGRLRYGVSATS